MDIYDIEQVEILVHQYRKTTDIFYGQSCVTSGQEAC